VSATEVAVPGDHEKRCWSSLGRKTPPTFPQRPSQGVRRKTPSACVCAGHLPRLRSASLTPRDLRVCVRDTCRDFGVRR